MNDLIWNQIQRRKDIQKHAKIKRALALYDAITAIIEAENYSCSFCKDLPRGCHELKHGCDELYGLIIDWDTETASCPQCKRIMAQWDY